MRTNRTKPESERGWLGCRLRGGLVVGALLFSGVGARGYLVAEPEEGVVQQGGVVREESGVQSSAAFVPSPSIWIHLTRMLPQKLQGVLPRSTGRDDWFSANKIVRCRAVSSRTDQWEGSR
ncbi:MAG: hypothetical protein CME06_14225 [Gemmatimonadetes bacterium]|nr:hypothetical protein [Gemmatimonadota bacterium]